MAATKRGTVLTAELLTEIRAKLRSTPASSADKRSEPRAGIRAMMAVIPIVNGKATVPFDVWVRDLSARGIGILSSKKLPVDSSFVARLPYGNSPSNPSFIAQCVVTNCRRLGNGGFHIGATLSVGF